MIKPGNYGQGYCPMSMVKGVNYLLCSHIKLVYFRRRKSNDALSAATSLRDLQDATTDFVSMLVPNPTEGQDSKARIGQKDVDEVSEMSERLSEASLDLASLLSFSSSDEDEMNSLEQQRDLEHTEYSVLPLRRSSRCFEEEASVCTSGPELPYFGLLDR